MTWQIHNDHDRRTRTRPMPAAPRNQRQLVILSLLQRPDAPTTSRRP
jgi:hypothetical protein